jgi:hypothetical protein
MDLEYAKSEIDRYKKLKVSDSDIASAIEGWDLNGNKQKAIDYLITWKPKQNKKTNSKFNWKEEIEPYEQTRNANLQEMIFLIEGMLARPCLAILAAVKKLGKSWFVLLLALSVSTGDSFLGLHTRKTSVVYMALEDGRRRINQRLKLMKAPKAAPINFLFKFPALNSPLGREQFINMIDELKPGLIIIDTLAASKNALVDENDNSQMADLMNWFHQVCTQYDISILIVAHHGKKSTGDAGFDIRGGSAIPGATDVNMGLYKNRETGTTNLVIEGRDIPALELTIKFDEGDYRWYLQGETKDLRRRAAEDKIFEAIISLGGRGEVSDIAKQAGIDRSTAQLHLQRLRNEHSLDYESLKTGKNKVLKNIYIFKYKKDGVDTVEDKDSEAKQSQAVDTVDEGDENSYLATNSTNDNDGYLESIQYDEGQIESEF